MTDAPETKADTPRARSFLEGPRAGMAALAVSAVALVAALAPYASGGSFDQRVRAYLLRHPEMLQEMSTALRQQQEVQSAQAVNERAAANPGLLAVSATDPTFGPADARVTVIEYFDFRCPGCKATAPEVLRLMAAHPDVRFVFKDWPMLDGGDPSGVSHQAARAAMAAHQEGKYLPVFRALMAEPSLNAGAIERILSANGVTATDFQTAAPTTARHLAEVQTSASALQLVGTPTFFINGKASPSIQPEDIDRAIRQAKAS